MIILKREKENNALMLQLEALFDLYKPTMEMIRDEYNGSRWWLLEALKTGLITKKEANNPHFKARVRALFQRLPQADKHWKN